MKRLFAIAALLSVFTSTAFAQATKASNIEDATYERIIENKMEVEFRSFAYKKLKLNSEEINDFDPVFKEYMNDKTDLIEEKYDMFQKYSNMDADERDRSDFVDDYLETEIDELQLKRK